MAKDARPTRIELKTIMGYDAFPKWSEALLRLTPPGFARRVPNMENFNSFADDLVEDLVSVASDDFYSNVRVIRSLCPLRAFCDKLHAGKNGQQHIARTT